MDADAKFDATLGRQAGVALDHAVLYLDGAAHGVDHAPELNETPVAGALHDTPVMHGDGRIDQIATEGPEPRQCAIFVRASKPAVSDHIGREDRHEFPGLGHDAPLPQATLARKTTFNRLITTATPNHCLPCAMSDHGPFCDIKRCPSWVRYQEHSGHHIKVARGPSSTHTGPRERLSSSRSATRALVGRQRPHFIQSEQQR